jgi:hypothetical protein
MAMSTSVTSMPIIKTSVANWVVAVLVLLNLAFSGFLGLRRTELASPKEPAEVITQANKLFSLMKDFSKELQDVAGQANYPSEDDKNFGKQNVKDVNLRLEMTRLAIAKLNERNDRDSLKEFVEVSCASANTNCMALWVPPFSTYQTGKFDDGKWVDGKNLKYANTSRLESMHDDYMVLLAEMLKDAK